MNNSRGPRAGLGSRSFRLGFLVLALHAVPGFAQQVPNGGRILESTKVPDPGVKPDQGVLPQQAPAAATAKPKVAGPKIHVSKFVVTGNTVIPEADLLALLADRAGKDASLDDLQEAADVIQSYYREHHYFLAQAFVPPQKVADGVIEIRVVEGRLGKSNVIMDPSARLHESVARNYLDNLLPAGTVLTETNVEKPLLLVNDLPGVIVRSTLKPGSNPGESDLDLVVSDEGKYVDGNVQIDNGGSNESGKNRAAVTLNARDLTGLGDFASIRALVASSSETELGQASYTLPVGASGAKLSASFLALKYRLGGAFAQLNADGTADVTSLSGQYPLIRSRNLNLFLVASYDYKRLIDRRNSGASEDNHVINAADFELLGDSRDGLLGGGLNSFKVVVTDGHHSFLTGNADDVSLHTNGTYQKLDFDFKRLQNLGSTTALLVQLAGQGANKNLTSAEKVSLGGPDGVRAHPVGEAAGDDVLLGTVELRQIIPPVTLFDTPFQLTAFYDAGYSNLNHTPAPGTVQESGNGIGGIHRTLKGAGVGINLAKRDDFLLKVDLAYRLGEHSQTDDASHRIWALATKYF